MVRTARVGVGDHGRGCIGLQDCTGRLYTLYPAGVMYIYIPPPISRGLHPRDIGGYIYIYIYIICTLGV